MALEFAPVPLFSGWNSLLRELRERGPNRRSQAAVGKVIGVTGKTISAYERGEIEPQLSVFDRLLGLYGITSLEQLSAALARTRGDSVGEPSVTYESASDNQNRMTARLLDLLDELETLKKQK